MKNWLRGIAAGTLACAMALAIGCSSGASSGASAGASASGENTSTASVSASAAASAAAALADGEYTAAVTLEGGTGKATVESPAPLKVANGMITATLTWSSPNYDQMVVDGVQYLPVNTEGNSVFEVPIAAFDEDLAVQAETTAMSEPHMIDYTLHFDSSTLATSDGAPVELEGAAAGAAAATAGDAASASAASASAEAADLEGEDAAATTQTVADFHNPDLGNGWEVTDTLELKYATQFSVDYYDGGYKLACLSDGGRYLMVPEGKEAPEGIADDIVVIQQPLSDVYMVASDTVCLFDALDALDTITVSGIAKENWYIPNAAKAMDEGKIVYGGKYSAPDYELLLSKGCKLAIESTMINHTPEVRDKLVDLGIPVLVEMSSYESEPLGRTEWVKLYGAMLNKEDKAAELFDAQAKKAEAVVGADTGKTVAFFYINSNGAAVVRKPGDYVTKMIALAGGKYVFTDIGDDAAMSSVTLEMERFYVDAKDADVIIYNATIDNSVSNLQQLIGKSELLSNFKAVQNGEVWVTEQNMYQQMMATGDIISDMNKAISGESGDLTYLHKLA